MPAVVPKAKRVLKRQRLVQNLGTLGTDAIQKGPKGDKDRSWIEKYNFQSEILETTGLHCTIALSKI